MIARLRCCPCVLPFWFALTPLLAQRFAEADRSALPRECGEVQGVFVADFDGDQVPDLVLADARFGFGANAPRILRGDGRGAWTVVRRSAFDVAIGVADVDGDGDRDVLTVNGCEVNDGFGGFTTVSYQVPVAFPSAGVVGSSRP